MKQLPQRPNIDHLKRQAKDLLVLYRSCDLTAIARFAAPCLLQPVKMIRQSRSSDFVFTTPNRAWLVLRAKSRAKSFARGMNSTKPFVK